MKYACSKSLLMLTKGKTRMDLSKKLFSGTFSLCLQENFIGNNDAPIAYGKYFNRFFKFRLQFVSQGQRQLFVFLHHNSKPAISANKMAAS